MLFLVYFWLISPVFGLYDSSDDVIQLTPETFSPVESGDGVWFVEFFAPWCGHCQRLAPEWKKAAAALKGVVNVAAVDADKHSQLSSRFSVRGFPTIMIFGQHLSQPVVYSGSRDASSIVNEALDHAKKLVHKRLHGGSSSDEGSGGSDVIQLTDSDFDEKVLKSEEPWLVEFYAPWCGHCKNLKPHWESAATKLKGTMKLGAVDATTQNRLTQKYNIRGFPTIKFFPAGLKSDEPVEYDGGRTAEDIVRWAEDKTTELLPPPEIKEITSQEVLHDACEKHPLCVIAVLPLLLDCDAKCRNDYLDLVRTEAERFKQYKWGWIWTEGTKQPELEKTLDVGFGYPALLAMHGRKQQRVTMRGPFNKEGIHDFLLSLSLGGVKLQLFPVTEMPTITTVEPWDGQDAKPIEEEDIDLDDIKLDL